MTFSFLFAAALTLNSPAPGGPGSQTHPTPPVNLPAPPTRGLCRPDPGSDASPEAIARRFHEIPTEDHAGVHSQRGAMAALLTPDVRLFNGHDNVGMSGEAFLSFIGVGRAGRTQRIESMTSGGTVVTRERTAAGSEIVTVVRTDGGCIASVATFYD